MNTADQVVVQFNENQVILLNICLGFLMFGVALDLKLEEFKEVSKNVRSIVTGLVSQWIMLPLLTLTIIWILKPQMSIAMGMILVASCPGGNVSNYAVHLAGANTWLSVILTTFSTLFCVVSTPLIFNGMSRFLYENNALSGNFDISFYQMAGAIFQLLFVPMLLGIAMAHYYPGQTLRIKSWVKKLSMMIFIGFVIAGIWANIENIAQYVHLVFLLVLVHNGLALAGGYGIGTLGGLTDKDRKAVSIETGIQNSGLALVLIFNFFDGIGGMALIAAWWSIWHLISALSVALFWHSNRIAVPGG